MLTYTFFFVYMRQFHNIVLLSYYYVSVTYLEETDSKYEQNQ
jgi:hypothetical protein